MMSEFTPMPTRSMAETFEHVMKRHYVSTSLIIVGPLFMVLGVAIAVEPKILVWVMALTFVGFGSMMLVAAAFIRRLASRMQTVAAEFRRTQHKS